MVKKGYLVAIVIVIIVLVGLVIILKKPKSPQEYFETGVNLHKNVEISAEEYRMMSPEEEEEYCKMVISSTDSAIKSYQEIIDKYPESKWADDAQFCIAHACYITAHASPANVDYADRAIEAFQKFITNYPEAKLEPQTIEGLSFSIPPRISSLHAVAQWQIASLNREIKKDYPQALIEYNKIIDKYPQTICAHPLVTYEIDRLLCPELNDYTPAIETYQKLLKTRINTPKDVAYFEKRIKEFKAKQATLKKQG